MRNIKLTISMLIYRDYFIVGECVRFLLTKNRTSKPAVKQFVYYMTVRMSAEIIWYQIFDTDRQQTRKRNTKIEFHTIFCFVFLLNMQPSNLFQINEATNVFFMILCGCFIIEIVLNLSSPCTLGCEQANWVRKCQPIKTLNDKYA